MTSRVKSLRLLLAGIAAALFLLAASSCDIAGDNGRTFMTVHYDTAWTRFERLEISWIDPSGGAGGLLFDGSPSELRESNRFSADGYNGQKIAILFKGYIKAGLAYEEHRGFDGAHPDVVTKIIVPLGPGGPGKRTGPPRLSAILADTLVTIHDSVAFQANATLDSGTLKSYGWDYDGDGLADESAVLGGASAVVKGFHRYAVPGTYAVTLKAVSSSDSAGEAKLKVTVLKDEPTADAGRDQTVFPEDMVNLVGVGKDRLGKVATLEWKIGAGEFAATETGVLMVRVPAVPGDVKVTFRVRDDDSQSVEDDAVIHVIPRNESNLTGIGVSAGILSPQFNPGLLAYTDTVGYEVESIKLTPAGNGVLTVNDNAVESGKPSAAISLKVGNNPVNLTVKSAEGPAKTYWLNVVRMPVSSDGDLSALVVTGGTLDSVFNDQDTLYVVSVPNATGSTTIKATLRSAASSLTINGFLVESDVLSPAVPLDVGTNNVVVQVTTRNGVKKSYSLIVIRAASGNSNLSGLALSAGALAPTFDPGTLEFALSVGSEVAQTTVTATVQNDASSLTINGGPMVSGIPSTVDLVAGANSILLEVTAGNGQKSVYTVRVTRAGNKNADLSGLESAAGPLVPSFAPEAVFYSLEVANGTSGTTVTPIAAKATSSLTINGKPALSGTPFPVQLAAGQNPITITVASQAGDKKSYTIVITRAPSANADLESLGLSAGALSPSFAASVTVYASQVANDVAVMTLTPKVAAEASVSVNGAATLSGKPSVPIPLSIGSNAIPIVVTAQSGATKTYTVTVARAANGDAGLSGLTAAAGPLSPAPFVAVTTAYSIAVAFDVASTTITPTASAATSTITVAGTAVLSGAASNPVPLAAGANSIPVVVTAQNGDQKTYTLSITRVADANADLSALAVSAGSLSPVFASATTGYSISVANSVVATTVTPTVAVGTSTVRVNGNPVASGSPSAAFALNVGLNAIPVVVTSQGGGVKTYTVSITRAANADASLSDLSASSGALVPAPFAPANLAYSLTVANSVASTTVTATTAAATTTIAVNGTGVASGTATGALALALGSNTITVTATAENGDKRTYSLTVTRATNGDADLSALAASAGALTPAFASGTVAYAFTVANGVAFTTLTPTVAVGTSTVKVNGTSVASGAASGAIPLNVGANAIPVTITAQNNSTKTYTVTVTRSANGNADLSALAVSASPAIALLFEASTTSYSAPVANSFGATTVTATAAAGSSSIKVNGTVVASGAASASIPLNVGSNSLSIVVTSQDLGTKTYTVNLTRAANANADLSGIALSAGTLSPSFSASETAYTAVVPMTTATLTVAPTVAATVSILKVNGSVVASGQASGAVNLAIGFNPITLLVTAQSGAQKTYTVNVRRQGPPIDRVSGGYAHSLILKSDGTLWATGLNDNGQLGDGTVITRKSLVFIMSGVAKVAAGKAHSLIVKTDGTLWGTGSNAWGRLGLGSATEIHMPVQIMSGVADVATRQFETLVLKTDGSVWGMGRNAAGELGDGTSEYRLTPVPVTNGASRIVVVEQACYVLKGTNLYQSTGASGNVFVQTLTGIADVAGGVTHTALLKSDGTVWAWGNNGYGQVGAEGAGDWVDVLTQVMSGVSSIATGDYHTLFLKSNGELWGTGFNEGWGLGDGTQVNRRVSISIASGVKSISAGGFFTHFLTPDGSLWGCGPNGQGELGAGDGIGALFSPTFLLP